MIKSKQAPIVVIGAGISGLNAAHALHKMGKQVLILEARSRLGGRIYSEKIGDAVYDLGASWIHGIENNPIWALVQQHQIETTVFNYDESLYYHKHGVKFTPHEQHNFEQSINYLLQRFTHLDPSEHFLNALDALHTWLYDADFLDFLSAKLHIDHTEQIKFQKMLLAFFKKLAEDPCASDLEHLAADFWQHGNYFAGDEVIFPQGYAQIIDVLSKDLTILTQHAVQSIDYSQALIQIKTQNGACLSASQVVISVPLGVLKQQNIQFIPELPMQKQQAIQQLGFGTFNKLFVSFERAFWKAEHTPNVNNINTYHQDGWLNFLDLSAVYAQPTLLFLFGGQSAIDIEKLSCQQLWQQIHMSLNATFKDIPQPTHMFKTAWGMDEFSQGSFSYQAVGQNSEHIAGLKQPIQNQLFFAGEHLAQFGSGTVHGAYASGLEVAQLILDPVSSEEAQ